MADEIREVKLPSGATLKINDAPFRDAHALYQSVLKMLVFEKAPAGKDKRDIIREYLPLTLASPEVHAAVMKCFERCLYNHPTVTKGADLKVTEATFESLDSRGDFVLACLEVQTQNLDPFLSGLLLKSDAEAGAKSTTTPE